MLEQRGPVERTRFSWILLAGVVMSLGWGLRGYIGGGPFGAMIPGVFVTLIICQCLGFSLRSSSIVVACGTLGIAFGGNMTYGQTLGLIRQDESFLWGLTGTTVKGAVWGLLGGAVIGLGLISRRITWRQLAGAVVVMLAGFTLGLNLVNQPRLIYFSDPIVKPRDESWAGYLTGGMLLLCYLRVVAPRHAWPSVCFSVYGTVGGAIGFGVGSLFLAFQPDLPEAFRWLPCWKFMEFFFGLAFGMALGACAVRHRHRLVDLNERSSESEEASDRVDNSTSVVSALLVGLVGVPFAYFAAVLLMPATMTLLADVPDGDIRRTAVDVFFGFTGVAGVLIVLSRRWQAVAWQVSVAVTILAAAIDWQRDLLPRGNIDMPAACRILFVAAVTSIAVSFVWRWQRQRSRAKLMQLFIFAACTLMAIGYMMGLGMSDIWWMPPEAVATAGGRTAFLWNSFRGEIVVHSIFTVLFIISIVGALTELRRSNLE